MGDVARLIVESDGVYYYGSRKVAFIERRRGDMRVCRIDGSPVSTSVDSPAAALSIVREWVEEVQSHEDARAVRNPVFAEPDPLDKIPQEEREQPDTTVAEKLRAGVAKKRAELDKKVKILDVEECKAECEPTRLAFKRERDEQKQKRRVVMAGNPKVTQAMKEHGIATWRGLSECLDIPIKTLSGMNTSRSLRTARRKVAEFLGEQPQYLWPHMYTPDGQDLPTSTGVINAVAELEPDMSIIQSEPEYVELTPVQDSPVVAVPNKPVNVHDLNVPVLRELSVLTEQFVTRALHRAELLHEVHILTAGVQLGRLGWCLEMNVPVEPDPALWLLKNHMPETIAILKRWHPDNEILARW